MCRDDNDEDVDESDEDDCDYDQYDSDDDQYLLSLLLMDLLLMANFICLMVEDNRK